MQKFVDTVRKNGKQMASSSKLFLSVVLYINLIDSLQYQNNIKELSFEFSVWINKGSYVWRSLDFFKKSLGLLLNENITFVLQILTQ